MNSQRKEGWMKTIPLEGLGSCRLTKQYKCREAGQGKALIFKVLHWSVKQTECRHGIIVDMVFFFIFLHLLERFTLLAHIVLFEHISL